MFLGTHDKEDYQMLKSAYRSKTAPPQRQDVILRDRGVRWAAFNVISDWLPASKTVLDFMHNIFLGMFDLSTDYVWLIVIPQAQFVTFSRMSYSSHTCFQVAVALTLPDNDLKISSTLFGGPATLRDYPRTYV
jgi:hypothetical protein